jgi:hypothetical protein
LFFFFLVNHIFTYAYKGGIVVKTCSLEEEEEISSNPIEMAQDSDYWQVLKQLGTLLVSCLSVYEEEPLNRSQMEAKQL